MILIFVIAAIVIAASSVLEKTVVRKRKISIELYHCSSFLAITLLMLPLLYFFWKLSPSALSTKNIIIFLLVIVFSIAANLLSFYSLKREKMSNLEPVRLLEPLFVVLLAILFSFIFGEVMFERNTKVIIPALLASCALIFSHVKKHHLKFGKHLLSAVFGSFFFALELVTSRLVLDFYSPITFYFLRCAMIFVVSFIIFRPKFSGLNKKIKFEILIIAATAIAYRILVYYGYLSIGVVHTTLMVMLGPIFVYLFAWKFLKEKIEWRNIAAAAIIIGSILYTIWA